MANNMGIPINPSSSKWGLADGVRHRSDIKTALKRMCPDGGSMEAIKQLVTTSLSPITIIEFFNTASRTLDILCVGACGPSRQIVCTA